MPDNETRSVVATPTTGTVPVSIPLGSTTQLDLSWMPEDQRRALLTDYARNSLSLAAKAGELGIEVNVLRNTLDTLAKTTQDVSEKGDAVTITHVQNSKFGRTEVMMGNTESATKGKLSRSQTGEINWMPIYIIGGVIALIVIVSIFVHH